MSPSGDLLIRVFAGLNEGWPASEEGVDEDADFVILSGSARTK